MVLAFAIAASDRERFWSKFDRRGADDCWPWTAFINPKSGYGYFAIAGRSCRAHRVAWQIASGADPGALYICHRCDNPRCVNPNHLFPGSQHDNMRDCVAKGRLPRHLKTHCKYGHALTPENTRVRANNDRLCRECDNRRSREHRQRRRGIAA